jgi:hypothetical protein
MVGEYVLNKYIIETINKNECEIDELYNNLRLKHQKS